MVAGLAGHDTPPRGAALAVGRRAPLEQPVDERGHLAVIAALVEGGADVPKRRARAQSPAASARYWAHDPARRGEVRGRAEPSVEGSTRRWAAFARRRAWRAKADLMDSQDGAAQQDGPGPGHRLDDEVDQGVGRLRDLPHAQRRFQDLLDAVMTVGRELELPVVLRRLITTAMDLVDA